VFPCHRPRVVGQCAEGPAEGCQHLSGVIGVKQINRRRVLAFKKANLQLPHEADYGHPEIIPHHHDALNSALVALPQSLYQLRVLFLLLGVQPLLELVEDDDHLLAYGDALPSAQCGQRCLQAQVVRQ